MGTTSSSELAWNIMKPLFTTARKTESPEEAAKRKGAVLGGDDVASAEIGADLGTQEARRFSKEEIPDSTDEFRSSGLNSTYVQGIHKAYTAQKRPSGKTLTNQQISLIHERQFGEKILAYAA